MPNIVIRVHGGAHTWFLQSCDFEAHGGRGHVEFTKDPAKAMQFNSNPEAFDYWRTTSKTNPVRPDGQPNRPLTAYTVEIGPL